MHVLVIDDEAAVRQIIAAMVKKAGHSVDTAENVREASAKLVRGDVDVAHDLHIPVFPVAVSINHSINQSVNQFNIFASWLSFK